MSVAVLLVSGLLCWSLLDPEGPAFVFGMIRHRLVMTWLACRLAAQKVFGRIDSVFRRLEGRAFDRYHAAMMRIIGRTGWRLRVAYWVVYGHGYVFQAIRGVHRAWLALSLPAAPCAQ